MARIFSFPGQSDRDWNAAQASIRSMLAEVPHDEAELSYVLQQLRPAFLSASAALSVPVDVGDADAVGVWAGSIAESLLFRIFLLELELYRLKGPTL